MEIEIPLARPCAREISRQEAGPSGCHLGEEEVDSDDIKVVYSEGLEVDEPESTMSHLGEGILLKNRRSV